MEFLYLEFSEIFGISHLYIPLRLTEPENMCEKKLIDYKTVQLRNNQMLKVYRTGCGEENRAH